MKSCGFDTGSSRTRVAPRRTERRGRCRRTAAGAALIAFGVLALSRTTRFESWPNGLSAGQVALLAAYAAFMLGVCLLACVVPARRALRVEPMVAMRVE